VSCAAQAVDDVLSIFRKYGFEAAAVIGEVGARGGPTALSVR
jgi:hypothetical protein